MDWLNWKNLIALILGGVVAGAIIAVYNQYQNSKREEIGLKLYEGQKALYQNKTAEVEKVVKEVPPPSRAYLELLLGDHYYQKLQWDKALTQFSSVRSDIKETDRGLGDLTLEKEAYILYLKGDYRKALDLLKEIDETAPNFCSAELLKAQILVKLHDTETAKGILERVLESCRESNIQITAKWLLTKMELKKEQVK